MPSATASPTTTPRFTKFTNCRILKDKQLILDADLWIDSQTGKILRDQEAFYEWRVSPDQVIDLQGRILAPGLIDCQLNGAQGFDYSVPCATRNEYERKWKESNRGLARTGVTSYLPTLVTSVPKVYQMVLSSIGPSGANRCAEDGAESLGVHVEGPFLNPARNGIHNTDVLRVSTNGLQDILDCYGVENVPPKKDSALEKGNTRPQKDGIHRNGVTNGVSSSTTKKYGTSNSNGVTNDTGSSPSSWPLIKMITAAPEVGNMLGNIHELTSRGIIYSIGHSDATYEEALAAVREGATMVTHLFNAMRPFYHRNPGIFGLLGQTELPVPYFGVIADGIHLHPTSIKIVHNAHAEGLILVTDAMRLCGQPDGVYPWTNGDRIIKNGPRLTLEGSDKIAGGVATLIECVNNFRRWTGVSTGEALAAATSTPAKMLGLDHIKGTLESGADADLVVLGEVHDPFSGDILTVDQVWKFGVKIFDVDEQ